MHLKYEKSIIAIKNRVFETSGQLCWILPLEVTQMINLKFLNKKSIKKSNSLEKIKIKQYEMG